MRPLQLMMVALLLPAAAAAQVRTVHPARRRTPGAINVAPNERTELLAFERGLKVVSVSTRNDGCKVVTIDGVVAPENVHFASGVAGKVVSYSIRAGYAAGQPSPSQPTLKAADDCAMGGTWWSRTVRIRGAGDLPLGGYPHNGLMWNSCATGCAVYPPPTSGGNLNAFLLTPRHIRVPSTPGLGRVTFRVYAWASWVNGHAGIAAVDSTNTVTVTY